MFILVEEEHSNTDIYAGKTYINQSAYFPCTVSYIEIENAKKYTSRSRAESACRKLNEKVGRSFTVKEIDQD